MSDHLDSEPELRLPLDVLAQASVSGGEYSWRPTDLANVIDAARRAGLACIGGQVQWRFPDGTCEAFWLNFDSAERIANEPWPAYVDRSAREVRDAYERVASETDWTREAMSWEFIRSKAAEDPAINPEDFRWCVLYFAVEPNGD